MYVCRYIQNIYNSVIQVYSNKSFNEREDVYMVRRRRYLGIEIDEGDGSYVNRSMRNPLTELFLLVRQMTNYLLVCYVV